MHDNEHIGMWKCNCCSIFYSSTYIQGVPERSIRSKSAVFTIEGALRQKS